MRPSPEAIKKLGKKTKYEVVGGIPICSMGHPSWKARKHFIEEVLVNDSDAVMEDVCDKTGLNRYEVICKKCGEKQGTVWAKNKSMENWCSFRYAAWHDKDSWYGCVGPQISPSTGMIHFECCCGEDTRDFQLNMHLKDVYEIEVKNRKGRAYNKSSSRFILRRCN